MTDQPPKSLPHNLDAEKATLGAVLIRPSVFSELDGLLTTDDFFLPAHREIWDGMRECDGAGHLDTVALADEMRAKGALARLEGGEMYFLELSGFVPTAENARHYAGIVREKATLRRLIALALELASRATGDVGAAELLTEARGSLDSIEVPSDDGPVRVGDVLEAAKDVIESRARDLRVGSVMSGIVALDQLTGGFRAGQQIVIAARPGGGKSALSWTTAIRAAMSGSPALCFSLEMSRQELVERAITFAGNVPGLGRAKLDLAGWDKVRKAEEKLRHIPLWVDDRKLSMGRISAEARRWRSRHARDVMPLLVVDYLGLVRSSGRSENRQAEVAAWSRAFKVLAGDLKCPLILVAQLNRQSVTGGPPREPVLSDLRDSGAIEQDADMVIFPWRDNDETPEAKLIVAKHRNGRTGFVRARWSGELMAFFDDQGADFAAASDERYGA